jgi:hypothetical protein
LGNDWWHAVAVYTISFQHDVDHQRIKQIRQDGTTLYINAFGVGAELFGAGTGAARWTDYLSVGNAKVGMRVTNIAAQTVSTRYFHTDHLGSVAVITDENGVGLSGSPTTPGASGAIPTGQTIRPAASPARARAASPARSSSTRSRSCT